jgi:prephenate dehydrogenase
VLIIGGTGEMGQWFTRFFKDNGYEVTVWGSGGKVEIARKMGVDFAPDLDMSIYESDIVIITVPIDITEQVIKETAPKMKSGSLLMDLTSLKVRPTEAMKKHAPANVEILGTHPMFGPSISSLHGQIFILTPIEGRCQKWFPVIRTLLEDNGAHIEVIDAHEHDRFVSVIQGLTHFAYITIGTTFNRLDFSVAQSRRFMSPVYDIMVDFVGRILGQNPYLYAFIQMENPEVLKVHEAFMQECRDMSAIVREHDVESFITKMKDAAVHFGDTSAALRRSDKLINSKIAELDELVDSIGMERGLRHIYSDFVHVGIVKKVTPRNVILSGGSKHVSLKLENIRLLSTEELLKWKAENLRKQERDISVIIPEGADPQVIQGIINANGNVISVQVIDMYTGIKGEAGTSVTYRVSIIGDSDASSVNNEIATLLCGIGCKLRG